MLANYFKLKVIPPSPNHTIFDGTVTCATIWI
jgi:hypothetical protein